MDDQKRVDVERKKKEKVKTNHFNSKIKRCFGTFVVDSSMSE